MRIGLIGYGRFGRFAAGLLSQKAEVVVWDPALARTGRLSRRLTSVSLEEAAGQTVVILAVPVSALREVLHRMRSFVVDGAIVIDVCAVKARPIRWMASILPSGVSIIGSHPFFGPDSYTGTLKGHRVVLCPVRGPATVLQRTRSVLSKAGLAVEIMAPDAHDRKMAETVFLTQFVGRLLASSHLGESEGWTVHSRRLRTIVDVAKRDSPELFLDMWRYNPHARSTCRRFGTGWRRMQQLLESQGMKVARRRKRSQP